MDPRAPLDHERQEALGLSEHINRAALELAEREAELLAASPALPRGWVWQRRVEVEPDQWVWVIRSTLTPVEASSEGDAHADRDVDRERAGRRAEAAEGGPAEA